MSRVTKGAIAAAAAAAAAWGAALTELWPQALFAAPGLTLAAVCLLAAAAAQRRGASAYRAFVAADGAVTAAAVLFGVHNMMTDTGWFAGLAGLVVLLSVLPAAGLALLAAWLVKRKG